MNICEFPLPARHNEIKFRPVYLEPAEIQGEEKPRLKRGHEYKDFRAAVAEKVGTFTSYDSDQYPMRRASVSLTRMRRDGSIIEVGKIPSNWRPLKTYKVKI